MVYRYFKDLAKITASDKVLRDKAFNIAKISNMMNIKEVLLLWFIIFLIKKSSSSGIATLVNEFAVNGDFI